MGSVCPRRGPGAPPAPPLASGTPGQTLGLSPPGCPRASAELGSAEVLRRWGPPPPPAGLCPQWPLEGSERPSRPCLEPAAEEEAFALINIPSHPPLPAPAPPPPATAGDVGVRTPTMPCHSLWEWRRKAADEGQLEQVGRCCLCSPPSERPGIAPTPTPYLRTSGGSATGRSGPEYGAVVQSSAPNTPHRPTLHRISWGQGKV